MAEANSKQRKVEMKKKCENVEKKTNEKPQKCAADGGRDDSNVLLHTETHIQTVVCKYVQPDGEDHGSTAQTSAAVAGEATWITSRLAGVP